MPLDTFGQPVGFAVDGWSPRQRPPRTPMIGRWCRVEPVDVERHAARRDELLAEAEAWRASFDR